MLWENLAELVVRIQMAVKNPSLSMRLQNTVSNDMSRGKKKADETKWSKPSQYEQRVETEWLHRHINTGDFCKTGVIIPIHSTSFKNKIFYTIIPKLQWNNISAWRNKAHQKTLKKKISLKLSPALRIKAWNKDLPPSYVFLQHFISTNPKSSSLYHLQNL